MRLAEIPPGGDGRFRWHKRGLVFRPDARDWSVSSALNPTPVLLDDRLRIFAGMRDAEGRSRVGWVDLDRADPGRVVGQATTPSLDIGRPGTFDDSGVVPTAVLEHEGALWLYYAGYQRSHAVRMLILGGLAVSHDGGERFERVASVPVLERVNGESQFRTLNWIVPEANGWRGWYSAGDGWNDDGDRPTPRYDIRTIFARDLRDFAHAGDPCIPLASDELRASRPVIVAAGAGGHMFFSSQRRDEPYRMRYAYSLDGRSWRRADERAGLDPGPAGFDSQAIWGAGLVEVDERTLVFYNGDDMGAAGFGLAELTGFEDARIPA